MSSSLMFMPFNPKNGKSAAYNVEEFHEQLNRYGIELPELEEGSQYYSLQLPVHRSQESVEEEVMILIEDDYVLGVSIDRAQDSGRLFWWQLLQMGYLLCSAADGEWFVSSAWAKIYQASKASVKGMDTYNIIEKVEDFESFRL